MKHLEQVFSMRRRLTYYAEELGLSYPCELKLTNYDAAETRIEDGTEYSYPATFDVIIESWDTFKLSFRPEDGRWIREGASLGGAGLSTAQMYRRVRNNLRAHARHIEDSKLKAVGRE